MAKKTKSGSKKTGATSKAKTTKGKKAVGDKLLDSVRGGVAAATSAWKRR